MEKNEKKVEKNVSDFQQRVKNFLQEYQILQNRYNVTARPIITTFGPDLQLQDKLAQPTPVEKV